MGKLMKYELRKQLFSKIVTLIVLGICEIGYFAGIVMDKDEWIGTSIGVIGISAFVVMVYFGFETLITYSNDLKTKQSYMLFLVPRSSYEIVGAKMLTAIVQMAIAGIAYVGLLALDIFVLCVARGSVKELFETVEKLMEGFLGLHVDYLEIFSVFALILVAWMSFVILAMLAITISTTILANKKGKGFVSFIIYFVLNFAVNRTMRWILTDKFFVDGAFVAVSAVWLVIAVYGAVMVLSFFATSYLLDKHVSV